MAIAFVMCFVLGILLAFISPQSNEGARRTSRGRRMKSTSLVESLIVGQIRTERRNSRRRGVMCSPGGSKYRR
jgi:hypothetical protein